MNISFVISSRNILRCTLNRLLFSVIAHKMHSGLRHIFSIYFYLSKNYPSTLSKFHHLYILSNYYSHKAGISIRVRNNPVRIMSMLLSYFVGIFSNGWLCKIDTTHRSNTYFLCKWDIFFIIANWAIGLFTRLTNCRSLIHIVAL